MSNEEILSKRRNGIYTCLDCSKILSKTCRECKNWHEFELEEKTITMTYAEKSKRYEEIKNGGIG